MDVIISSNNFDVIDFEKLRINIRICNDLLNSQWTCLFPGIQTIFSRIYWFLRQQSLHFQEILRSRQIIIQSSQLPVFQLFLDETLLVWRDLRRQVFSARLEILQDMLEDGGVTIDDESALLVQRWIITKVRKFGVTHSFESLHGRMQTCALHIEFDGLTGRWLK